MSQGKFAAQANIRTPVPKVVIIVAHQQRIKCILNTFISCDQRYYNQKKFKNASMFMLWREGTKVHIKLIYPGEVFRHKEKKSPHYSLNDHIAMYGIECNQNEQWIFLEEHTRIILVRHGSAEHNEKELSRKEDVPFLNKQLTDIGFDSRTMKIEKSPDGYNTNLTMFGQLQARRAGIFLKHFLQKCFAQYAVQDGEEWTSHIQFTVCASMLLRTQQTAAILLRWAGVPSCVPIHIIPCVHELARGCDGDAKSVFTRMSKENLLNPSETTKFQADVRRVGAGEDFIYRNVESNDVRYPVKISSLFVPFLPKLTFPYSRMHCRDVPFLTTLANVLNYHNKEIEAVLSDDEYERVDQRGPLESFPKELFDLVHPELDSSIDSSTLLNPPTLMKATPSTPFQQPTLVPKSVAPRMLTFSNSQKKFPYRQGEGIQTAHANLSRSPDSENAGGTRKKRKTKTKTKRKRARKRQTRK